MDDEFASAILQELAEMKQELARRSIVRKGVVTDIDPLSVSLGNSTTPYTAVQRLDSYSDPQVDDEVFILMYGGDMLALGRCNGPLEFWGRVTLSFAAATSAFVNVSLPVAGTVLESVATIDRFATPIVVEAISGGTSVQILGSYPSAFTGDVGVSYYIRYQPS